MQTSTYKERQQTDSRETAMKSAGGQPCLYMHGWWKNVSLNGSQLSAALTRAKTGQGNKIWHYYCYYTAIINYPLSSAFTVCLAYVHMHHEGFLANTCVNATNFPLEASGAHVKQKVQKSPICRPTHSEAQHAVGQLPVSSDSKRWQADARLVDCCLQTHLLCS